MADVIATLILADVVPNVVADVIAKKVYFVAEGKLSVVDVAST